MNITAQPKGARFWRRPRHLEILALLLVLAGNAAFLRSNAFRCFNFYDMCIYLDGGWRMFTGQRPYADFIHFNTPVHLYLMGLFFKLFGVGKPALLAHLIVVHSAVILLTYWMARVFLEAFEALLVAVLTATSFYWSISFPWHDQTAHLWWILGLAVMTRFFPRRGEPWPRFVPVCCGLMAALSFFSKINIGTAVIVMFLFVFLFSPRRGPSLAAYGAGLIFGAAMMGLVIGDIPAFIEQVTAYGGDMVAARLRPLFRLSDWVPCYGIWLPFLIVAHNIFYRRMPGHIRPWVALYLGLTALGFFSILTGGIIVGGNSLLWGVYMAASFIVLRQVKPHLESGVQRRLYVISRRTLVVMTAVLIGISAHDGRRLKVWSYTGGDYLGRYALQSPPLKGWLFGRARGEVLDTIVRYVKANVPPDESLLVLSDMTVIYLLTGHESFRGMPIAPLVANHTPPPGPLLRRVRSTLKENPPDWIVTELVSFRSMVPYLDMGEELTGSYRLVQAWGIYWVFRRTVPAPGRP